MPKSLPTVSIVIPAYNEAGTIQRCLESCLNQTTKPFEIIVVNNLSTDDTAKIVRRLRRQYADQVPIRLLHQSDEQGITPTRNYGFDRAKGDVIGRIDADSIILPKWVAAVRHTFRDDTVAAATGPVVYYDMPGRRLGLRADSQVRTALDRMSRSHKFLFGSNMAIRRSAWLAVANDTCADKANEMHEDIDLALHLNERGFKIVYAPKMVGGMSARRLDDSPKVFYNYVMRFERTYKHHHIKSAAARIPIFIYLTVYFPVKAIRLTYDVESNKFSFNKLKEQLSRRTDEDELVI